MYRTSYLSRVQVYRTSYLSRVQMYRTSYPSPGVGAGQGVLPPVVLATHPVHALAPPTLTRYRVKLRIVQIRIISIVILYGSTRYRVTSRII